VKLPATARLEGSFQRWCRLDAVAYYRSSAGRLSGMAPASQGQGETGSALALHARGSTALPYLEADARRRSGLGITQIVIEEMPLGVASVLGVESCPFAAAVGVEVFKGR
jgi:hypothetical protein